MFAASLAGDSGVLGCSLMDAPGRLAGLEWAPVPLDGAAELDWLNDALDGQPRTVLWSAQPGLVVPESYRRHPQLESVCADSAAAGWPVRLRRSGGGIVPQGPGIVNLSVTYQMDGTPFGNASHVYQCLCEVIRRAFELMGIESAPAAVHGSFCDGRFNMAVPAHGGARKIAGTAQYWRRRGDAHAVLAHALILVDADVEALTERANAFEAALSSGRSYRASALTTVAREWCRVHGAHRAPTDLLTRLRRNIAAAIDEQAIASN